MSQPFTTLLAHAGHHDPAEQGLLHALTQPDHLLALAAVCAGAFALHRVYRRLTPSKPAPQAEALPPSSSGRRERIGRLPASGQG